jgi:hypothetical protein
MHEYYEILYDTAHPSISEISKRINSDEILNQLSESNKKELQEVIYDRLIADKPLIKNHPEYINELINIDDVINEIENNLLKNNYNEVKKDLIWVVYYDAIIPGSNKINEIFLLDDSLKKYIISLKTLMEKYI